MSVAAREQLAVRSCNHVCFPPDPSQD
jgi:hypothetical protein